MRLSSASDPLLVDTFHPSCFSTLPCDRIQFSVWLGSLPACPRSRSGSRTGGQSGERLSAPLQRRWRPSRAEPGGASPRSTTSTPPWPAGVRVLSRSGFLVSGLDSCECDASLQSGGSSGVSCSFCLQTASAPVCCTFFSYPAQPDVDLLQQPAGQRKQPRSKLNQVLK